MVIQVFLTIPFAWHTLRCLLGFLLHLFKSQLTRHLLKDAFWDYPFKSSPIYFFPFAMLYFFLYDLSLADIIMYIYLLTVCAPHWKVSSMRERTLFCASLHLQRTERISLAHIGYSENIYEIVGEASNLMSSRARTAELQMTSIRTDFFSVWFFRSFTHLGQTEEKTVRKYIIVNTET